MDLHYLKIFNSVATYESYKKASEELHISQPALSIQIKKLEDQLGLKLFDKVGNHIRLNQNGLMIKEYTTKIFKLVDELNDSVSSTLTKLNGTLNIGASFTLGTYLLPVIIENYKKQYPNVKINLHIGNTAELVELINSDSLDIALHVGDSPFSDTIKSEYLFTDRLAIIASKDNPYTSKESITRTDLNSMNFIVHETDSQLYLYYINFINEFNLRNQIIQHVDDTEAVKKSVASNLGITLIPYIAVKEELELGLLKELSLKDYSISYPYNLIYKNTNSLSFTLKSFIDILHSSIS